MSLEGPSIFEDDNDIIYRYHRHDQQKHLHPSNVAVLRRPFLRLAKRYFTTAEVESLQKLKEEWKLGTNVKGAMNGAKGGI